MFDLTDPERYSKIKEVIFSFLFKNFPRTCFLVDDLDDLDDKAITIALKAFQNSTCHPSVFLSLDDLDDFLRIMQFLSF